MNAVFRALSDPTRREIIRLLRDGPRTSGEIATHFPTAWATISRHLGVLRDAELIRAERDGQQVYYELDTTVVHDLVQHLVEWMQPNGKASGKGNGRSTGKRNGQGGSDA